MRTAPKDIYAWVDSWEQQFAKARDAEVPETKELSSWLEDLIDCLSGVVPIITMQLAARKAELQAENRSYEEIGEQIRVLARASGLTNNKASKIQRGAFPAITEDTHNESSPAAYPSFSSNRGNRGRGRGSNQPRLPRRPRKESGFEEPNERTPKRLRSSDRPTERSTTRACAHCGQMHHGICFYISPEAAPDGWTGQPKLLELVQARVKAGNTAEAAQHRQNQERLKEESNIKNR
ncbi:hypothetical protein S7711_10258 [Stachybotrys chartarum IBT 7711]|uniref:Uncharacterized protein n=1 Tax=Stachybotrys chartarum (strain CBS 109288 / IBT 7711) TaxID=1280523 RepID=A0A084BA30_STACB|nr:hypothetical protein S7711_10258 [Stachybotrys chartarum IBT 7711]